MDMLRRIFGLDRATVRPRDTQIIQQGPDSRVVSRESHNPVAIAARENFAAIYGRNNMPPGFAMHTVIEVQDDGGNWVPVIGDDTYDYSTEAQAAALASWRETGIIGPQAINPNGSLAVTAVTDTGAPVSSGAGGNGGAAQPAALPNARMVGQDAAANPALAGGRSSRRGMFAPEEMADLNDAMFPRFNEGETLSPMQKLFQEMLITDLQRRSDAANEEATTSALDAEVRPSSTSVQYRGPLDDAWQSGEQQRSPFAGPTRDSTVSMPGGLPRFF